MNALLCIGCDEYLSLNPLFGAEADGKAMYEMLKSSTDLYDPTQAVLLLSPNLPDFREALKKAFPLKKGTDGFTFIFAGHGTITGEAFYLCLKDTEPERISTTALAINEVFAAIADFAPPQVNIVVDACCAGASSSDLGSLIKSKISGSSKSSSIAFLGACGSDQFASEDGKHGFLTTEVLQCLKGETEVQTRTPHLDLLHIGSIVSPIVAGRNNQQRPLAWGLSLFGESRFAKNPLFGQAGKQQFFPIPDILPFSPFGLIIRDHSEDLWTIYRELPTEFLPRQLLDILGKIFKKTEDPNEIVALTEGLASTLSSAAEDSDDLLAPATCLTTCLVSLLAHIDKSEIQSYLPRALGRMLDQNTVSQTIFLKLIRENEYALQSPYAVAGDLYFLPLRVTRLLGWIGADVLTRKLLPSLAGDPDFGRELAGELITGYIDSLVAVSDSQAPSLHVFFAACQQQGWDYLAKKTLTSIYTSFCDRGGNVTRWDVSAEWAVQYILSLSDSSLKPMDWKKANPSNLLPVLLLWGTRFGLAQDWNLRELDRLFLSFFIPTNSRDFAKKVIEHGQNNTFQVGFGLWRAEEFIHEYDQALAEALGTGLLNLPPGGDVQCIHSALLFPNRVPFFITEAL